MSSNNIGNQMSLFDPIQTQTNQIKYTSSRKINPRNIGYSNHPLYSVWQSMKQRCHNQNAANYIFYGARGINVCERWHDFQSFLEDMESSYPGKGYHIDRIDERLNYNKDNCRWIEASENVRRANRKRFGTKYKYR